jgi:hypothetical protein
MIEAKHSSKMSVLTRATWRNIQDGGILHSHHCENLKSYITLSKDLKQWPEAPTWNVTIPVSDTVNDRKVKSNKMRMSPLE